MTGTWLPLAATLLAAVAMYICCIRPMRNKGGGCCPTPPPRTRENVEEEIRHTREELRLLHEQPATRQTGPPSSDPRPGSIG